MRRRSARDFTVLRLPRVAGAFGVIVASGIVLGLLIVLAIVLLPARVTVPRAFPALGATCTGGAMQIVAHQDDDLYFQSPDLLHDIQAGRCVRTVYVTAGDAAKGDVYWKGREEGSRAAYAQMAGVANLWTTSDAGAPGQSIQMEILVGAPGISIVTMRLAVGASAAVTQPGIVASAAAPAPRPANSRRFRKNAAFSASVISSHIADSPIPVRPAG